MFETMFVALVVSVGIGVILWRDRTYYKGLYELEVEISTEAIALLKGLRKAEGAGHVIPFKRAP